MNLLEDNLIFYTSLGAVALVAVMAVPLLDAPPEPIESSATSGFQPFDLTIQTDPGVQYRILNVVKRADGLVEVSSRRNGKSGVSYSKRLVDCGNWTFKYIADGERPEDLDKPLPDEPMAKLVSGSISMVISYNGCKAVGLDEENVTRRSDQPSLESIRASARARISRYRDQEGWTSAGYSSGELSPSGYLCDYLRGETDYHTFKVGYIYDYRTNRIDVQSWALGNDPLFASSWQENCG